MEAGRNNFISAIVIHEIRLIDQVQYVPNYLREFDLLYNGPSTLKWLTSQIKSACLLSFVMRTFPAGASTSELRRCSWRTRTSSRSLSSKTSRWKTATTRPTSISSISMMQPFPTQQERIQISCSCLQTSKSTSIPFLYASTPSPSTDSE